MGLASLDSRLLAAAPYSPAPALVVALPQRRDLPLLHLPCRPIPGASQRRFPRAVTSSARSGIISPTNIRLVVKPDRDGIHRSSASAEAREKQLMRIQHGKDPQNLPRICTLSLVGNHYGCYCENSDSSVWIKIEPDFAISDSKSFSTHSAYTLRPLS